jgi:hypothetical protein
MDSNQWLATLQKSNYSYENIVTSPIVVIKLYHIKKSNSDVVIFSSVTDSNLLVIALMNAENMKA